MDAERGQATVESAALAALIALLLIAVIALIASGGAKLEAGRVEGRAAADLPEPGEDRRAVGLADVGDVRLLELPTLRELARISAGPGSFPSAHFRPRTRELLVSRGPGSLERWSYARGR